MNGTATSVPEEEFMKLPDQEKGTLRIRNADRAVQPTYLYDLEKDDRTTENQ